MTAVRASCNSLAGACAAANDGEHGKAGYPAFAYSGGVMTNLGALGRAFNYGYGTSDAGGHFGNPYIAANRLEYHSCVRTA